MANTNQALILPIPDTNAPAGALAGDLKNPLLPPVEIPSGYAWVWWTLGLIAAAIVIWFIWKKWQARAKAPKPVVLIPPHRRAKERLHGALALISDPYAFCSLVSDVVRIYLEERFDLHAPDRTTEEFLEELRSSNALEVAHKQLLEAFLERCDLVKFARYEPTEPELRELYDAALRLIDETTLVAADNPSAR